MRMHGSTRSWWPARLPHRAVDAADTPLEVIELTADERGGPADPPARMRTRGLARVAMGGGEDLVSTILVPGGAGYIGSMVSRELLARGHRVVATDVLLFGGKALLDLLSNPDFS